MSELFGHFSSENTENTLMCLEILSIILAVNTWSKS